MPLEKQMARLWNQDGVLSFIIGKNYEWAMNII
jgi:hypothetical protein